MLKYSALVFPVDAIFEEEDTACLKLLLLCELNIRFMEHQDNTRENATFTKRQPKPEEQALVDELSVLTTQYGAQFPHICRFVQKGGLSLFFAMP